MQFGHLRAQVPKLSRPESRFDVYTNTAYTWTRGADYYMEVIAPFRSLVVNLSGQVQVVVLTAGNCRISEEPRCPEVVLNKGEAIETGPDDRNRQPKSRPATADELSGAEKETSLPKN
jgi:hypothetical protein